MTNTIHGSQTRRIAEYNASGNALIREYIWLGDKPLAVVQGGVISYIRADNINRPVFATNAAGVKVWTASYLPFGGVHVSTGTPINLRFPGQWFELESSLHQNWMRDYDPTTGRYLQADPLGLVDGASVWGYAGQSPVRFTDFYGLAKDDPWPTGPNGKKDFICGNYRIICEIDPHKGRHCSWSSQNGDGRTVKGKKTCIREDGTPCEGSDAPPSAVLQCLRDKGYCPKEESPFEWPNVVPFIFPALPNRTALPHGGGGHSTLPDNMILSAYE